MRDPVKEPMLNEYGETPIFRRGENSAVYGVDETRRVSFAHQNAPRSGDGSESDNSSTVQRQHSGRIFNAKPFH